MQYGPEFDHQYYMSLHKSVNLNQKTVEIMATKEIIFVTGYVECMGMKN